MATYAPAYRARVYAPRSADPNETTVLRPASNAPHAEPFQVATRQGIAGYRPILHPPAGRRGAIDPLSKRTDSGELVLSLLDNRTGAANADRWVSAFTGDARGRAALLGCRVEVEESLDAGATWARFFTGRVEDVALDDVLTVTLSVRDLSDDLALPIFTGAPHASITYAAPAPIFPAQVPSARPVAFPGTIEAAEFAHQRNAGLVTWRSRRGATDPGRVFTEAVADLADHVTENGRTKYAAFQRLQAVALVTPTGGAPARYYATMFEQRPDRTSVIMQPYARDGIGTVPLPTVGTVATLALFAQSPPSATAPLAIDDVHPVTLWRHILEGRFSALTDAGVVRRAIPYDAAAFAALEADGTLLPARYRIDAPALAHEWIEANILAPYHLAYRLDEEGRVVPVDLRRSLALASAPLIDGSEAVGGLGGLSWAQERKGASSYVTVVGYKDPSAPPVAPADDALAAVPLARPVEVLFIDRDLDGRALDLGVREVIVKASPFRWRDTEADAPRAASVEGAARGLIGDLKAFLGGGVTTYSRAFRRAGVARETMPGQWRRVALDEPPNAASNRRGGIRLGLCVDRVEDGDAIVLSFLDAGADAIALAPTLGPLTLDGNRPRLTVTLNTGNDPVAVQYVVTSSSVNVTPGDTAEWRDGALLVASGTAVLPGIPGGRRVFVRARSEPATGSGASLPSPWIAPSPAFLEVAGIAAPTGLAVSTIGRTTALVTWAVADADWPVLVYVAQGGTPPASWEAYRVTELPRGSTRYRLRGLTGPTTPHVVGVAHRDPFGSVSSVTTASFTTTLTDPSLPRPAGLALAVPATGGQ